MHVLNMEIFYVNNYSNCNSENALSALCSGTIIEASKEPLEDSVEDIGW